MPVQQNFIFASCFLWFHFPLIPQKILRRLGGTAVPTRKARLVGLLVAWTRQAASVLLELSSPILLS
jgi:hypothetical protein